MGVRGIDSHVYDPPGTSTHIAPPHEERNPFAVVAYDPRAQITRQDSTPFDGTSTIGVGV